MQVIEWRQFLENGLPLGEKLSSVTIGVFDGVHRGHQSLIEKVVSHNAQKADSVPVVIAFRQNHKGKKNAHNIQTFRQKTAMFERLGVKITLVIDFTESFRHMAGLEFLEILLKHGRVGFFAVGTDFRCGYRLDTDASAIQKFFVSHNIPVEVVPDVMEDSLPISSSRIRSAITGGNLHKAQTMLGYPYTIDLAALQDIVLPPPGRYQVLLREKPEEAGTKTEVFIESGNIRIPETFAGSHWEFAEFSFHNTEN